MRFFFSKYALKFKHSNTPLVKTIVPWDFKSLIYMILPNSIEHTPLHMIDFRWSHFDYSLDSFFISEFIQQKNVIRWKVSKFKQIRELVFFNDNNAWNFLFVFLSILKLIILHVFISLESSFDFLRMKIWMIRNSGLKWLILSHL